MKMMSPIPSPPAANQIFNMFLGEEELALLSPGPMMCPGPTLEKNMFLSTTPVQKPKKKISSWAKALETIEASPSPLTDVFHMTRNTRQDLDLNLEEELDEVLH
jgi:hypothetical protein